MSDLATDLRNFRQFAWNISPAFGTQIDQVYLKGMGFGDSGSLQSVLDALVSEIQQAAAAAGVSAKNYFDARTQVDLMAAANRAGVPVDQYLGPAIPMNTLRDLLGGSPGKPGSNNSLLMVGLGAMALFMFMETQKTSRHIGSRR